MTWKGACFQSNFAAMLTEFLRGRPYKTLDDFGPFMTPHPLLKCFVSAPLCMKSDLAEGNRGQVF